MAFLKPLYEIANEYQLAIQQLTELLQDDETISPDDISTVISDSLSDLQGVFEAKAVAVGAFSLNLKAELLAVKDAEDRIVKRRKMLERKVESINDYLLGQFQKTGIKTVKCPQFVINVKNNPQSVVFDDESLIPERFKEEVVTIKISKTEIAKELKSGIDIDGCHLEQKQRLEIK